MTVVIFPSERIAREYIGLLEQIQAYPQTKALPNVSEVEFFAPIQNGVDIQNIRILDSARLGRVSRSHWERVILFTSRIEAENKWLAQVIRGFEGRIFVIQDFWGDSIPGLSGRVTYLFRDELCITATSHLSQKDAFVVVGGAKFANVREDFLGRRLEARQRANWSDSDRVIGYFGQAPDCKAAYRRTVVGFARALRNMRCQARVLYRPHWRESEAQVEETAADICASSGVEPVVFKGGVRDALLASDLVATCFSNCVEEAIALNLLAGQPFNHCLLLQFDPEMRQYFRERTGWSRHPLSNLKVVDSCEAESGLSDALDRVVDDEFRWGLWDRIKNKIVHPDRAAEMILDRVASEEVI